MSQSQTKRDRQPRTSIREAYEISLHARRQWMSVRGRTAEDSVREQAHADLHESVMAWFEALVPYIATRPGEVKDLWEDAPLWPERPATREGYQCPDCETVYDPSVETCVVDEPGDICPNCGGAVGPRSIKKTDDEGRVLYEWACGIKRLSAWTNRTVSVEVEEDDWSTDSKTVEQPQRLNPTVLMRAARYLDLAAEDCGLLEDTDDALETGEL